MESATPKNINKYDVVELIGRGGMGVVYKAIDRSLNRVVAIKMVTNQDCERGDALNRFYREAQYTANLRHPNIVTVYDLGEYLGSPYLVMEYLDGQSLDALLNQQSLTLLSKLDYVRQVCKGLHYAHTRQPSIIHRDIKPPNIMVVDEVAKIVDFGIARLGQSRNTRSGQLMGSYHYMSPEQVNDAVLDGRTDLFSTGVVLYQLLTTTLPFNGSSFAQTLNRIVHSPPPPLSQFLHDYPAEFDDIISRALAKNPVDRYQTADEFAFDLLEVEERLKRELFRDFLERAEKFLGEGRLDAARQELAEVLRIDYQHARANELLRQVQQATVRQQKRLRAGCLRETAERALAQYRLADAVAAVQEAVKLDDSNAELQSYRDHVVALNEQMLKIDEALSRAERACVSNDLNEASRAADEALQIDPNSTRAKSFKAIVDAKIAENEKRRHMQELLDKARSRIDSRDFSEALRTLRRAQALDPTVSGVGDLIAVAEAGRQQEERQKALEKVVAEIRETLGRRQPSLARSLAMAALVRFPGERVMLELKTAAEQDIEALKRERAISAIRAVLTAGDFEAADRRLGETRRELGDSPELNGIEQQIRTERMRSALQEVETALHDAQDLVRFEAEQQAFVTLESVSHLIDLVPDEVRARFQQVKDEINERVQAVERQGEQSDLALNWDAAAPETRWGTSRKMAGDVAKDELRLNTLSLRKHEKRDHDVAELTPAEGINVPDGMSESVTSELNRESGEPARENVMNPTSTWGQSLHDALPQIEKQLAAFIGPVAKVVVRKAASATSDPGQFYMMLAASIDRPSDRQAFLAQKGRISAGVGKAAGSDAAPFFTATSRAGSGPCKELTPEVVERAARLLAPYTGPIAGILAKKTAQRAGSLKGFYELLADNLETEEERNQFLRDIDVNKCEPNQKRM